ncbi:hypothetical protein WME79_29945 [Sorangium sp. So ce726]|uniref:hypothetical protein n=1 Tax=Sorangium sp. So ce726 TaxID=3133319 RepID=UPI003F5EE0CD
MPYRDKLDAASGTGKLITVRRYLDPVAAQMDRTLLSANGIESHVFEAASYNPLLSGAAGGTQLQVREGDLRRVEGLLEVHPGEAASNDDEEIAGVRCPRCELAYCFHERLRLEGSSAATALAILATPLLLFLPRRWHCHKCGHVWDDPKEGPAAMTKLEEGDPRPVFRLRRAHSGMGLFLGLLAGFCGAILVPAALPRGAGGLLAATLLFGAPLIGWAVGYLWQYDLCSEPGCRTALTSDRSACPRCSGAIAGVVRSADEHYAAAADFRRELSALRAADQAREGEKKRRKKRPAGAAG